MALALELMVAAVKINKYAVSESGDTLEMIERPGGGISFVLVDGQHSGKGAKKISNMVARKCVQLLAEGVRDGAAARAAHDYLYAERKGQVSATLNIASIDLASQTLVLSRNSHCPTINIGKGGMRIFDEASQAIGVYRHTKPIITELPLEPFMIVVIFTDGLLNAGQRKGLSLDIPSLVMDLYQSAPVNAQTIAEGLLSKVLELDDNRPVDDTSILVISVPPGEDKDNIRRLNLRYPI